LCKKDYVTEEEARAQQRAVEPLMNEKFLEYLSETVTKKKHRTKQIEKESM
jgi:hypothetical protein